jgi:hypothetical protein
MSSAAGAWRKRKDLLFLKKKKQKDFYFLAASRLGLCLDRAACGGNKSLLLLFFRKEGLSSLSLS